MYDFWFCFLFFYVVDYLAFWLILFLACLLYHEFGRGICLMCAFAWTVLVLILDFDVYTYKLVAHGCI